MVCTFFSAGAPAPSLALVSAPSLVLASAFVGAGISAFVGTGICLRRCWYTGVRSRRYQRLRRRWYQRLRRRWYHQRLRWRWYLPSSALVRWCMQSALPAPTKALIPAPSAFVGAGICLRRCWYTGVRSWPTSAFVGAGISAFVGAGISAFVGAGISAFVGTGICLRWHWYHQRLRWRWCLPSLVLAHWCTQLAYQRLRRRCCASLALPSWALVHFD